MFVDAQLTYYQQNSPAHKRLKVKHKIVHLFNKYQAMNSGEVLLGSAYDDDEWENQEQ